MKRDFRTPALLLLIIALSAMIFNNILAENRDLVKPENGSITFGKEGKSEIKSSSSLNAFKNIFADAAEAVIPAVVTIKSTEIDTLLYRDPYQQYGSLYDFYYGRPLRRGAPQQRLQRKSGVGSGVIVSKDGYILTNSHVVKDADEIVVTFSDNREFDAEIIGVDSLTDVAVIKLKESVKDLPVVHIGNSDKLRPGSMVVAIGNPFNLSSTVTTGIVSALGRHASNNGMYQNFIQTDAAINPGNSGGALINLDGELIGINTMIFTKSGGSMGIGFAIPINMAKNIMEQLIYDGKVSRGWLGISIGNLDKAMMEALGVDKRGVLVNDVFENQPAQKAGIKGGDVIISINGSRTKTPNELRNTIASIKPGTEVSVKVIRSGNEKDLNVTIASRDKSEGSISNVSSGSGLDIFTRLGIITKDSDDGLKINQLNRGEEAERKGLLVGDIIEEVKPSKNSAFIHIKTSKELKQATASVEKGGSIILRINRGGTLFYIAVKL